MARAENEGWARGVLVAAMVAGGVAVWVNWFIQDDGYISFRYAWWFAAGEGLVWEPGSDEFGYTNFLFTLLVGLGLKAGLDAETAAAILTVSGFFGTLLALHLVVRRISGSALMGGLAALAYGVDFTASSYGSGSLETSMQTAFVFAAYAATLAWAEAPSQGRALLVAGFAVLAGLTRLDSAVMLAPAGVYLTLACFRRGRRGDFALMAGLVVVAMADFLLWCLLQYGAAFPNTAEIKAAGLNPARGLAFVKSFLKWSWFWPALAVFAGLAGLAMAGARGRAAWAGVGLAGAGGALWTAYVTAVGGGFMAHRLMLPALGFAVIVGFGGLGRAGRAGVVAALALAALSGAAGLQMTRDFHGDQVAGAPRHLNLALSRPETNWRDTGRALRRLLHVEGEEDPRIAVTAAGAIPYFSRLPTIDQLGLNDRWVARNGEPIPAEGPLGAKPGHVVKAPLSYLIERGVHLIIDHPSYLCDGEEERAGVLRDHAPYGRLRRVAIPVSERCELIAFTLTPHPRVAGLEADGVIRPLDW